MPHQNDTYDGGGGGCIFRESLSQEGQNTTWLKSFFCQYLQCVQTSISKDLRIIEY